MGILDRFFGRRTTQPSTAPAANRASGGHRSLQLLFPDALALDQEALTVSLRAFDPSMAEATCELDPTTVANGTPLGLCAWGRHVVQLVGFNAPMPPAAVEACVQGAHYGQELKARARAHQAHVLLYYAGDEAQPLEQYATLAAVAGMPSRHGALVVLNETARTSLPAEPLDRDEADGAEDALNRLRDLPVLMLYAGFLKLEVEGRQGVWMRTYGGPALGLFDLARLTEGHHQGQVTFDLFSTILAYLQESGATIAPGHTIEVSEGEILKFRAPTGREDFLESNGELLVVERVSSSTRG